MFKKVSVLLVFVALVVSTVFGVQKAISAKSSKKDSSKKIVSYIRTWGLGSTREEIEKGNYWTASDVQADKVTTLNIAFAVIETVDGEFDIAIPNLKVVNGVPAFVNFFDELETLQERYPNTRFNLSIGGWGADGFSDMALTRKTRKQFIENVLEWVEEYDFSGVDIDWEYPVNGGWGVIKSRPEDKQNFTYLMKELREALDVLSEEEDKTYEISFAGGANPNFLNWIEPVKVAKYVDYVKVMSYDLAGPWMNSTAHHANLYDYSINGQVSDLSVDKVIKNYIAGGFPKHKILLGVPFYGRGWKGVASANNGLGEAGVGTYVDGITYPDILKLMQTDATFKRYWDADAQAPYLYNGDVWITYEDKESLAAKAAYVKSMGLRGMMIWEYAHDMDTDLLSFLNDKLK
jgi:chitinase